MAGRRLNRRQLLKGGAAIGAAAATTGALAAPPLNSPADLAYAERLAGVSYTPAERGLVFDKLEGMVDRIRKRRDTVNFDYRDAPATVFNPRLPGRAYQAQENTVSLATEPMAMISDDDLVAFAPISAQAHWLETGQITSSRLTDIYLKRIAAQNGKLNAFITVTAELAREQAYQADREIRSGKYRGPLHGIPYGLKDLFDTKDILTTWGAAPYKDRVPDSDAVVTTRLRDAGAVLLGKTALGALAYGDKWFGAITRNPWNPDEGSSGSSAGSAAATAAGLCGFAIGTETLGSIVSPSARCGATGLRPTFGRVARTGAMPLCWSLDKVGPICRSVEDTALVLAAINGADAGDPSSFDWGFAYDGRSASGENLRIGYKASWFTDEDTAQDRIVLNLLKSMGFNLVEIELPDLPYSALLTNLEIEAAAAFEELTLSDRDDLLTWQEARAWPNSFRAAHFYPGVEMVQLDRLRRKVMGAMDALFQQVDVVVCPNFTGNMLVATNFSGHPSLTLPIGFETRPTVPLADSERPKAGPERRVPRCVTLWGNLLREDQLLGVGRLIERSINFAANRPDL